MNTDLKQKLADLKGLHEEGLIDEEEFRRGKDALLSSAGMGSSPASSGAGGTGSGSTNGGSRSKKTELTIDDEVSPFFPGATLGPTDRPYKLGHRLGAGGMGQVWQALDVKESESLGREVWRVVKILPGPATSDPGQYKAVRQEAYLAEQLRHPHIVSVFGWREDQITGIPFIVMEWLQGKDLGRVLAEEGDPGLPFGRVVELLDPVIEALDYAWKKHQLIHRDLKPANIFVTEGGEIKLLDFGIAARIGKTGSSINLKGREQAGTPGYRPPEAKAKRKPAPTWDVYGLGALTYELLTGSAPFDEDRAPYTPAPDAPENVNEEQWQVLQNAFAFDEKNRIPGVKEFWQALQKAAGPSQEEIERQRQEEARAAAEAEHRRKLEELARLKAGVEAEAKQRAEAEAKQRAEAEARRKAEAEAKQRAAEQARKDAEERARKDAQEDFEATAKRRERAQAKRELEDQKLRASIEIEAAAQDLHLWKHAKELNTLEAYQEYFAKSKRQDFKDSAQARIAEIQREQEHLTSEYARNLEVKAADDARRNILNASSGWYKDVFGKLAIGSIIGVAFAAFLALRGGPPEAAPTATVTSLHPVAAPPSVGNKKQITVEKKTSRAYSYASQKAGQSCNSNSDCYGELECTLNACTDKSVPDRRQIKPYVVAVKWPNSVKHSEESEISVGEWSEILELPNNCEWQYGTPGFGVKYMSRYLDRDKSWKVHAVGSSISASTLQFRVHAEGMKIIEVRLDCSGPQKFVQAPTGSENLQASRPSSISQRDSTNDWNVLAKGERCKLNFQCAGAMDCVNGTCR